MTVQVNRTNLQMGATEWALLVLLSVIWGGSFLFGRIAVQELPPLTVAWVRVVLAATVLLGVVFVLRYKLPATRREWEPFVVLGLLNNVVPFSLILWGQQEIGAGLASVFNATTPLFAGLVAHVFTTDEKLTSNKVLGVFIGILGVVILVGPTALANAGGHVLAELAVLGAALSYGFAGLWGRRLRGHPPLVSACCQLVCSSAILTVIAGVLDRPWLLPLPTAPVIAALAALAILCTAIAYIIFFAIIARAGSTNVMLVTLLIPCSAMLLGWIFLQEQIASEDILGAFVIGLALVTIDGRAWTFIAGNRSRRA